MGLCMYVSILWWDLTLKIRRLHVPWHMAVLFTNCLPTTILKPNPTIVYLHTYAGPLNSIYVTYYTPGCFGTMDFLKKDTCGYLSSWGTCLWSKSFSLLNSFQGPNHKSLYLTNYRINHRKPIDNIAFCCLGNSITAVIGYITATT